MIPNEIAISEKTLFFFFPPILSIRGTTHHSVQHPMKREGLKKYCDGKRPRGGPTFTPTKSGRYPRSLCRENISSETSLESFRTRRRRESRSPDKSPPCYVAKVRLCTWMHGESGGLLYACKWYQSLPTILSCCNQYRLYGNKLSFFCRIDRSSPKRDPPKTPYAGLCIVENPVVSMIIFQRAPRLYSTITVR